MKVNNMGRSHINKNLFPFLKKWNAGTEYHVWDFFYKNGDIVGSPHTKRLPSAKGKMPTYTSEQIREIKNAPYSLYIPSCVRRHHAVYLPHPNHKAKDGKYLASLIAPVFDEERVRNWMEENAQEDQVELYITRTKVKPYNETGKTFAPYKNLYRHTYWLTLKDFFEDYKKLDVNFVNLFIPQQKCHTSHGIPFYAVPNTNGQLYVRIHKYGVDTGHLLARLEKCIKKSQG